MLKYNLSIHQLSGLVVRVTALRLGGRESIPGHIIQNTLKDGSQCLTVWHGWIGGKISATY